MMIEKIRFADPVGPYILVGYSYGGYVALEMALQLSASGVRAGVVNIDTRHQNNTYVSRLSRRLLRIGGRARRLLAKMNIARPLDDAVPIAPVLYDDARQRVKQQRRVMTQQQRKMVLKYTPAVSNTPMVILQGQESIRPSDLEGYGWQGVANVLEVIQTEGDHLNLFKGEHETVFVEALDRALRRLEREMGEAGD